jgi:NTE family protein
VEALTGTPELFRPDSGVSLVDAVAASCAVPGVWPPVTIDGRRYIDGGMRSVTNADLATGFDRVLVLAPVQNPIDTTEAVADAVDVIGPDEASLAAFGLDVLSPASRTPSAEAGYTQGTTLIERVAALWT